MTSQPLTLESIVIDDEFASLMPRLTDEERTQLHVNMLRSQDWRPHPRPDRLERPKYPARRA